MKLNLLLFFGLLFSIAIESFAQTAPPTIVLNGETLLRNRTNLTTRNLSLELVKKRADEIVKTAKLYSVMDKEQVPPSGDKHDYMSQAPYWWADPAKPNGLPYIRRDGERNPELNKISDTKEIDDVIENSEITALAYFFTGNEAYAKHSANLSRDRKSVV